MALDPNLPEGWSVVAPDAAAPDTGLPAGWKVVEKAEKAPTWENPFRKAGRGLGAGWQTVNTPVTRAPEKFATTIEKHEPAYAADLLSRAETTSPSEELPAIGPAGVAAAARFIGEQLTPLQLALGGVGGFAARKGMQAYRAAKAAVPDLSSIVPQLGTSAVTRRAGNAPFASSIGRRTGQAPPVVTDLVASGPRPAAAAAATRGASPEAQAVSSQTAPGIQALTENAPMLPEELRRLIGSERAERALGHKIARTGPSQRPLEAELADLDQRYRRALSNERGAVNPRLLLPALTATAGGVAGGATAESPEQLGPRMLAGALGGGAFGALPALKGALPKGKGWDTLNMLRINSMLSGLAIPKNVATGLGAHATAALEEGSLAPLKELFNPENLRTFKQTLKAPTRRGIVSEQQGMLGPVGRTIGAIDETAWQSLKRAGLDDEAIDRLLLTKKRAPLFAPNEKTQLGAKIALPFQSVPFNVLEEGVKTFGESLNPRGIKPVRAALNYASYPAGRAIGEWVESGKGKAERDRRAAIASVLLAAAGPRSLTASMGATSKLGGGSARAAIGSMSPIPEFTLDPMSMIGLPPSGLRMLEKLNPAPNYKKLME